MIRQIRMDGKWVECGCIMGRIWMEHEWNINYMGGVWITYGCHMGYISGIWVEYGWNGIDGIISIIKNGKVEIF